MNSIALILHTLTFININIRLSENRLHVVKALEDTEVCECESCSFEVALNLAYIEGVWSRDGLRLKSKPTCRISTHGKKHTLTLTRVALGDAGAISFQAHEVETTCRLTVKGGCDLMGPQFGGRTGGRTLNVRKFF